MTTNIYLIRHGEVHNPKKIVYGRLPRFGLSKKGRSEIDKTAEFLKNKNISAIYSSPLLRARQTACIIQDKLNLPKIYILKDLLEAKTSIEGKLHADLDLVNLDYFSKPTWQENDDTIEQIAGRMIKSFKKFLGRHKGQAIVVVSHGDPIMLLKAYLNKMPLAISSIRPDKYLAHGEITDIQQIDDQTPTVKSVFVPKI